MALKLRKQDPFAKRQLTIKNVKLDKNFMKSSLVQFVTPRSYRFFQILGVDPTFLKEHPDRWANDDNFKFKI